MRIATLASCALLLAVGTAQAGSLDTAQVPSDAKWVVHVDFEQMRATKVAAACRKELEKHKDFDRKIKEAADKLGMNPMKDLLGATLYDNAYREHEGVVLIHAAKLDREKLVALFKKKHPQHTTSKHGDRVIYTWTVTYTWTDKNRHREHTLNGAFANDNTIALSGDAAKLKKALDVIGGKSKSLGSDAKLTQGLGKQSIFVLRAIDVTAKDLDKRHQQHLKNIKEVSIEWREAKDQLQGQYKIVTDSNETAKSFRAIIDGVKALATLKVRERPLALKLVNGLSARANGETLLVTYQANNDDVLAAAAKLKEMCDKRGGWHKHHKDGKKKDHNQKSDNDDLKKREI